MALRLRADHPASRPASLGGGTRTDRELVGPPTKRSDPASLDNQPAAYLVHLRRLCIDLARQILDACRHADAQLLEGSFVRVQMIEARWATYIADDLRRAGLRIDGPLKEVGLSRADVANPEARITYASYMGLIEQAALLLADPGYGLKLGASHDVRDNGLLGFIALNSPTLRDALANVERYIGVTNEGTDAVLDWLDQSVRCASATPIPLFVRCDKIPNGCQRSS